MTWRTQESFATGELSERINGLSRLEIYNQGCPELENAMVSRYGTAFRRWGRRLVNTTTPNTKSGLTARLIPFTIRDVGVFVIELTNTVLRIWDTATRDVVMDGSSILELTSPFLTADLDQVHYAQSNSRLYLCHPDRRPQTLDRDIDGNWSLREFGTEFGEVPPRLDPKENIVELTKVAGQSRVRASRNFFRPDDLGSLWRMTTGVPNESGWFRPVSGTIPNRAEVNFLDLGNGEITDGDSTLDWEGPWVETDSGNGLQWRADATANPGDIIQFTLTNGTVNNLTRNKIYDFAADETRFFKVIERLSATTARCRVLHGSFTNGETAGVQGGDTYSFSPRSDLRRVSLQPSGTGTGSTIELTASEAFFNEDMVDGLIFIRAGALKITNYKTPEAVDCSVERLLRDTESTTDWAQSWNDSTGYPRCATLHQDRLFLAGVAAFPNRIYGSQIADYENFDDGADDDQALILSLGDENANLINWMRPAGDLLVGAEEAEFAIRGQPLTPTQGGVDIQSTHGGGNTKAVQVGTAIIFRGAYGSAVHEMAFRFASDRYEAPDLTDLADHLFPGPSDPIVELAHINEPFRLVAARLSSGALRVLSYRRENGILAWSPWEGTTASSVIGVSASGADELWVCVSRNINGTDTHYIEILTEGAVTDAEQVVTSPGSTTISNLNEYQNEAVQVVADGYYLGEFTVSVGNQLDFSSAWPPANTTGLPASPASVTIGFGYSFKMTPQLIEDEDRRGRTPGRERNVREVAVLLASSYGGTVDGFDLSDANRSSLKVLEAEGPDAPSAYSGWSTAVGRGAARAKNVTIEQALPFHFEVLAVSKDEEIGS